MRSAPGSSSMPYPPQLEGYLSAASRWTTAGALSAAEADIEPLPALPVPTITFATVMAEKQRYERQLRAEFQEMEAQRIAGSEAECSELLAAQRSTLEDQQAMQRLLLYCELAG